MQTYAEFRPTGFDCKGLGLSDKQDWLVHPCGTNRDADCLTRSNFRVACKVLEHLDPEGKDHEVHRFGHWACGWFEIIVVRPGTMCSDMSEVVEAALADYPVLDESDFSEEEDREAQCIWETYRVSDRLDYIRRHSNQLEFSCFADLMACVKGRCYPGYASDIIG